LNQAHSPSLSDKTTSSPLDKSNRKRCNEMFDIPRFYISPYPYAVQYAMLYSTLLMSILLYCYEQLS
jgi:hypothetical protein